MLTRVHMRSIAGGEGFLYNNYIYVRRESYTSPVMFHLLVACCACILFVAAFGTAAAGTPLPSVCRGPRGDRTVSRDCPEQDTDARVVRFFFHKTRHCKRFSLCPSTATHLDGQEQDPPTINYFQNLAQCEEACTNVVECSREPLLIAHGRPGTETEEGEWREVEEDQRLGFGTTVTFRCDRGYGLPEGVWSRTCQLSGNWSGTTPSCNAPSCPPPPVENAEMTSFTYTCGDGYTLLNESSDSCTLSADTTHTLSCVNGRQEEKAPVCTRVEIHDSSGTGAPVELAKESGVYHYQMEEGSRGKVLTCGLEGVDQQQYPAQWILPKISNGEEPPAVEANGNTLTFIAAFQEQNDTYTCNICNVNTLVTVRVTP